MRAPAESCFHCGDPVPPAQRRTVRVDGEERPVCCAGCEAVAGLIAGSGLEDFYRYRTGPSVRPGDTDTDEWVAFDRDRVQQGFVRQMEDGRREAVFLVEGLYCAACGWLIERVLGEVPGVGEVQVNPATGRMLLCWDFRRVSLGELMRRTAALGYRPHPLGSEEVLPAAARERRAALKRLAVAGLGMMQVMMYAVALYAGAIHEGMDPAIERLLRGVSLLVATPVATYAGAPFFRGAWRDLRSRRPGMDMPVALAVGGAYAASVWNTLHGGEVYFDSVTMFVFFLTAARYLEIAARHRAGRVTESLATMLPATALRMADGGEERVALAELAPGDRVRVRTGETVPADGRILRGESHLDESMLTGEFLPRARGPGETVAGGSLNVTGPIDIEVQRVGQDTLVSDMTRLLERAQSERPRLALLADTAARWFIAFVLTAAAVTALYWWQADPGRAFAVTLAVLVVTCPCALSLATPAALVAGTARLARDGVLTTRAGALEVLARADHLVIDKTGTLTRGRLAIRQVTPCGGRSGTAALALAAALESHSEHPVARAFASHADGREASRVRVVPGQGVEGEVDGRLLRIGQPDWALEIAAGGSRPPAESDVVLADADGPVAGFRLEDTLRPDAAEALRALAGLGIGIEIASGDRGPAVAAVARRLGVSRWHARMRPEDKLARIRELQTAGRRVVAVGDGINDSPVLAGADASVAMGKGTALAQRSADMILLGENLSALPEGIRQARRTLGIIRQNLVWAVSYNLLALPLAAAGLLAPWMAAVGMSASSLLVVGNAMRLNGRGARAPQPAACPITAPRAAAGGAST